MSDLVPKSIPPGKNDLFLQLAEINKRPKPFEFYTAEELWTEEFHETPVNWTLLERGETLWLAPEMAVSQKRSVTLGYTLSERFRFGWLFAGTRVEKVGRTKGFIYAALVWVPDPVCEWLPPDDAEAQWAELRESVKRVTTLSDRDVVDQPVLVHFECRRGVHAIYPYFSIAYPTLDRLAARSARRPCACRGAGCRCRRR